MHAQVTHTQILPGKIDEAITIYRDSVMPVAKKQKGFRGIYLLVDRATGKFMSIHLWESSRAMAGSENDEFLKKQFALFANVFASPPTREPYEVAMRD
jgi:heme-degrading monooxygenase HmoA